MDTLVNVLGTDYCIGIQTDALMENRNGYGESPRPFLVNMRNKRLVLASEGREGQTLDSGLIKQLTGDKYITARALFQNPVTFRLTAVIFLITNHPPQIRGDDLAIWRRILRIPFTQRFVENPQQPNEQKMDKNQVEKLRQEYPGILSWLVRGCLAWQAQGLNPPDVVTKSTNAYQVEEDLVSTFIKERLIEVPGYETKSGEIYKEYVRWSEAYGYLLMTGKAFAVQIAKRFGEPKHTRTGSVYSGVGIAANST
jgi:putative DNA primase/helicase